MRPVARGDGPIIEGTAVPAADPVAAGMVRIQALDPSITADAFVGGARSAFAMILDAFTKGDEAALRPLLADDVFQNFVQVIRQRADAHETCENQLIHIASAEVVEADLVGRQARITVRYVSQQVIVVKDAQGNVVEGDPSKQIQVTDLWTFGRDPRARDRTGRWSPPAARTNESVWLAVGCRASACRRFHRPSSVSRRLHGNPTPQTASPGNTTPGEHLSLTPVDFAALPGGVTTHWATPPQLDESCGKLSDLPASQPIGREGVGGTAGDWLGPCGALRDLNTADNAAVHLYFETWFKPMQAVANGGAAGGLFTGYYEAELTGAPKRDAKHPVPLYARPDDLIALDLGPFDATLTGKRIWGRFDANNRLIPYWTRQEIEQGALGERAKVVLWVDDPVDAHILSIQGSGRVTLPDGNTIRVGFDGTNGRTFIGITRILMDAGKLTAHQATMPETRAWLQAHPGEATAFMDKNPALHLFPPDPG